MQLLQAEQLCFGHGSLQLAALSAVHPSSAVPLSVCAQCSWITRGCWALRWCQCSGTAVELWGIFLFPFVYRNVHLLYQHNSKPTIICAIVAMSEVLYVPNVYSQGWLMCLEDWALWVLGFLWVWSRDGVRSLYNFLSTLMYHPVTPAATFLVCALQDALCLCLKNVIPQGIIRRPGGM